MSNNQELSPTVKNAQKGVVQNKQTVSIRKVTIQSIAPVIQKVQEHISYLMEETSKLRKENGNLKAAMATQKTLQGQITTINSTLQSLTLNINTVDREKQLKILTHNEQILQLKNKIINLKQQAIVRDNNIKQIKSKNENYLQQIQHNKQDQKQEIQVLRSNIQNYYQEELGKINGTNNQLDYLKNKIQVLEEERVQTQKDILKIGNLTALYQAQRDDIKKVIERTSFLQNNCVMNTDYEYYKKHAKVQLQLLKTDVQKIVDEALTPSIRKFLPTLISKLDQLNNFSNMLGELYKKVEQLRTQHSNRMTAMQEKLEEEWNARFSKNGDSNTQQFLQIKSKMKSQIAKLEQVREEGDEQLRQKIGKLVQEIGENKMIAEQNMKEQIAKLNESLRAHIIQFGDNLIESKKEEIYQVLQNQKPQQKAQEQAKVFQIVNNIQPLLAQVRQQLSQSKTQQLQSKKHLQQKIQYFSNQMVKLKSNITIQTNQNKKLLDYFNKKLKNNDQINLQLSEVISKIVQSVMFMYSVSVQQEYFGKEHQVYVTYHDGVLLDVGDRDKDVFRYRRKEVNAQIAKRAVIKEFAKLIDHVILNQPHLGWNSPEMKPSHFFNSIHNTYIELFQQYSKQIKISEFQGKPERRASSTQKQTNLSKFTSTQLNMPKISNHNKKGGSNIDSMSKTIDFTSNQFTYSPKRQRYQKQQQGNNTNRKSIRLKKIDKKQV